LAVASPAAAHDPIILTDEQVDAAGGPRLPDGTTSFALYGVLDAAGAARSFTARFAGGERLYSVPMATVNRAGTGPVTTMPYSTPVERVPDRDDPAAGVAGEQAWYANAPPGAASTPPATGTPWATATPPLSASATTPASTGSATVAGAPASTGSGTVAEWLWPLLIATAAGATALAVGLYHGFVRPGRTRR
jgi:hypothetical protein